MDFTIVRWQQFHSTPDVVGGSKVLPMVRTADIKFWTLDSARVIMSLMVSRLVRRLSIRFLSYSFFLLWSSKFLVNLFTLLVILFVASTNFERNTSFSMLSSCSHCNLVACNSVIREFFSTACSNFSICL